MYRVRKSNFRVEQPYWWVCSQCGWAFAYGKKKSVGKPPWHPGNPLNGNTCLGGDKMPPVRKKYPVNVRIRLLAWLSCMRNYLLYRSVPGPAPHTPNYYRYGQPGYYRKGNMLVKAFVSFFKRIGSKYWWSVWIIKRRLWECLFIRLGSEMTAYPRVSLTFAGNPRDWQAMRSYDPMKPMRQGFITRKEAWEWAFREMDV